MESTPKNATRMPSPAANETAVRIRSSIVARDTPSAASFPSEIGLSITDACRPSSTSASTSARTAREKPQTLRIETRVEDQRDRACIVLRHAREPGLDPIDSGSRQRSCNLHFLLWVEHDSYGLLAVAERRVVQADRHARLWLERLRVQVACPHLRAVDRHAWTIPSGNGDSFSAPSSVDEEVVLDAETAAALDIASWLDCKHHAGRDLASTGLVRVRRLVRTRADPVADRV